MGGSGGQAGLFRLSRFCSGLKVLTCLVLAFIKPVLRDDMGLHEMLELTATAMAGKVLIGSGAQSGDFPEAGA